MPRPKASWVRSTEQTAESYAATFDTNVLGVLLSMKHELRVMLAQKSGSIVNVSSSYGSVGAPGASVYVASKHAVEGMTKSAALEAVGSGVRVNVVAPGTTDTGMLTRFTGTAENKAGLVSSSVPFKRLARPEEVASVIAFVASAKASYMIGGLSPWMAEFSLTDRRGGIIDDDSHASDGPYPVRRGRRHPLRLSPVRQAGWCATARLQHALSPAPWTFGIRR